MARPLVVNEAARLLMGELLSKRLNDLDNFDRVARRRVLADLDGEVFSGIRREVEDLLQSIRRDTV